MLILLKWIIGLNRALPHFWHKIALGASPPQYYFMISQELNKDVAQALVATFGGQGHEMVDLIRNNKKYNLMLGAIYGAFLGDALGSFCEFQHNIKSKIMNHVMTMPGEGTFRTDPGQLTDDSELALELAYGLLEYDTKLRFDQQIDRLIKRIAEGYVKWLQSRPFDIGHTCKSAFQAIQTIDKNIDPFDYVQKTMKATNKNSNSQSNGSMMRISPLAVFSVFLGPHPLKDQFILKQIRLTHSNSAVLASSLSWVNLLESLISRPSDNYLITIQNNFFEEIKKNEVYEDIREWAKQVKQKEPEKGGWAKVVWRWGLYYLGKLAEREIPINNETYDVIIRQVIKQGGDTDTNACIVGAMVGSVVGFKRLPPDLVLKVIKLNLTTETAKLKRPARYEPRNGFKYIYEMHKKFYY